MTKYQYVWTHLVDVHGLSDMGNEGWRVVPGMTRIERKAPYDGGASTTFILMEKVINE